MHGNRLLLVFLLVLTVGGCAANRPVLYPNAHYRSVGRAAAERDINDCIAMARSHGATPDQGKAIAHDTAGGAAVGAAAGTAAGAVAGNAGRGAAAGAAGGAAGGMARGIFRSGDPDPVFRNFVQRCLADRGYDVVGWN